MLRDPSANPAVAPFASGPNIRYPVAKASRNYFEQRLAMQNPPMRTSRLESNASTQSNAAQPSTSRNATAEQARQVNGTVMNPFSEQKHEPSRSSLY